MSKPQEIQQQADVASQIKRGRQRVPKPTNLDLRRHHALSIGRGNAEVNWDGTRLHVRNISEETANSLARLCLKGGGVLETEITKQAPKPGEPSSVMSIKALQEAFLAAGPGEALVEELIATATQGVITRDHVQFKTYRTRFNNTWERVAAALRDQGLLTWWRQVTVDGVGMKRFGTGTKVPEGAKLCEPRPFRS